MRTTGHSPDIFQYPASRAGRVAVALIALALSGGGLLAATVLLAGGLVADDSFMEPGWLAAPLFAIAVCGVVAAVAALMALVLERERSIYVTLALLVGLVLAVSVTDIF